MKLFISWSGKLSHQIAKELQEWFPTVINQIEPFVSSESIKKGDRWIRDINTELEQSNFGIVCLTRENLLEPWIMFEAGALSKNISQSRVTSLLFDELKQNDIKGPLSLFQNTEFEKEEFRKLVASINNSLGDKKISDALLNKSFEKWYPEIEEKIITIQNNYVPEQPKKQDGDNALNEILHNTKYISNVLARFNLKLPEESLDFAKFTNDVEMVFSGNDYNHPVRLYVNPISDESGTLKELTITSKGTFLIPSNGPSGRGILIEILFYSESDVFWTLMFHFHKGNTYVTCKIADIPAKEAELLRHETIWRD